MANAEGSVTYMPWANWTLRAFGGINFDNRVPGMAAPGIAGSFTGTSPDPITTAAGIKFESETSFYVGGGISLKF